MIELELSRLENREDLLKLMGGYFSFYGKDPEDEMILRLIDELRESNSNNKQFLAKDGDEYVGFVTLYETYSTLLGSKIIVMNDLYVVDHKRGAGIGRFLFNHACNYTAKLGYPKMEWVTEPTNTRARRFYDELGGSSDEWVFYSIPTQ
ncbi:MAG: N-acetyltransferase family protein [Candidatus Kariarchaeaceae archaeon]|jgi:GNAT superfamily N-acetyltransferase